MSSNSFLVASLGLSLYSIISSASSQSFTSFPVWIPFISSPCHGWASASATVLLMNIQDWFPLGWTGLISLQSNGHSRVFSNPTVQKHQFFDFSFFNLHLFEFYHHLFLLQCSSFLYVDLSFWPVLFPFSLKNCKTFFWKAGLLETHSFKFYLSEKI